ncbi:hypothetical protein RO3G_11563 [Lichtheimia corymbifera JMRC:FSU:9682]|uniref:Uncharacterized protein n=1 Tax=Lichtheimia corymbifera JMRC:FSU:9682 TaxID=1263082 RepID=A0A068SEV2_9FUNG|nr:hypothetical protein RO3G_11563 [Lichtheimia corymbifera JMRC:FSU:9682]
MVTVSKIISRITETRWSKLYISTALVQAFIIIILQALICSQNTLQASLLPEPSNPSVLYSSTTNDDLIPERAADRLGRIKWENLAFIGFQVWFIGMVFDATIYQNTAEILALALLNAVCAVLGALQVVDGIKWVNALNDKNHDTSPLYMAMRLEIALSISILIFACVMAYLSYEMSRQFGWNIYKKIGADVQMQRMYRMFQFFVLALKIDVFTEFLVSLFYVIQFAFKSRTGAIWEIAIQVVVTVLILPMLYFARTAGSTESRGRMITFIVFEGVVVVHYGLILKQTLQPNNNWYTWICLVVIGILIVAATAGLGLVCMNNFGRGLKMYVQRGRGKQRQDLEMAKNTDNNWQIDDD